MDSSRKSWPFFGPGVWIRLTTKSGQKLIRREEIDYVIETEEESEERKNGFLTIINCIDRSRVDANNINGAYRNPAKESIAAMTRKLNEPAFSIRMMSLNLMYKIGALVLSGLIGYCLAHITGK